LALPELAQRICDRHRGVGADGILFYEPAQNDPETDFSALIFNADGSKAEMSGNGVRCLAAYLHHCGRHSGDVVRIRTIAGIKRLELEKKDGNAFIFRSSLGQPITDPARIPSQLPGPEPVLDYPLEVETEVVKISLSSMGNPHCSTFWPDLARAPVDRLGPLLEHHACFPSRTNVEFIQVLDLHHLRVAFWERGVGRTMASGTGSSAAAVAAVLNGFAEAPVVVETELGELLVEWSPGRELFLTGPAEFICAGDYLDPGLPAEHS
jgi:diaminopimelate epimerase